LNTIGIIPSRLESTRLPNKALKDICGLPMIVHVYKRCTFAKSLDEVYVATDSNEISQAINNHGGKVIMTSSNHDNGTERIAEAASKVNAQIIVNIQGDEALVMPDHIDTAVNELTKDEGVNICMLVNKYTKQNSPSDIKVVLDKFNNVIYMSRSDIPSNTRNKDVSLLKAYHIVPFRKDFLMDYVQWDKGYLEQIEYNEYLRILERGHKIRAVLVESSAISVDTEEDLNFVRIKMASDLLFKKYNK